jgi:hypothetical protein
MQQLSWDSTYVVFALILGAMGIISLTQIFSGTGLGGPAARNLFLGVKVATGDGAKEQTAWIRALTAHSLLLVSPKHIKKGERLKVDMGAIPDLPDGTDAWVDGEVKSVRSLGGDPAAFEVRVRLQHVKAPLRDVLASAVRHLAHLKQA